MEDGFRDRADAGAKLAERLLALRDRNPIVVALPRGGVPVARPIATALGTPLEVIAVRKLGAPGNPELGMGAIAEDGTRRDRSGDGESPRGERRAPPVHHRPRVGRARTAAALYPGGATRLRPCRPDRDRGG